MEKAAVATATVATKPTLFVESDPYLSFQSPHQRAVQALLPLSDGSFVSFSEDNTAKRWLIDSEHDDDDDDYRDSNKKKCLRLLGTYNGQGTGTSRFCVVEVDDNTFLTGAFNLTVKEWNKTTCQCLRSFDRVCSMIRSNDQAFIVWGTFGGVIEMRKTDDLEAISFSFKPHNHAIFSICHLTDGSHVSGSNEPMMKRWDTTGKVLQTYSGTNCATKLIQLDSDTIVSASWDFTVAVWKVSTGQMLHQLTINRSSIQWLVKLSDDKFATGSTGTILQVWNGMTGECVEEIITHHTIDTMIRIGDSIVTACEDFIEVRRLKYGLSIALYSP